ncbi:hypothetical protein BGZ60DRAFT_29536 [Tricladium varicosporioides]|nr:hypothetical protein BGZ60DRAFT_29536 [Hymenoscyphus varicosporioides]
MYSLLGANSAKPADPRSSPNQGPIGPSKRLPGYPTFVLPEREAWRINFRPDMVQFGADSAKVSAFRRLSTPYPTPTHPRPARKHNSAAIRAIADPGECAKYSMVQGDRRFLTGERPTNVKRKTCER